MKEILRNLIKPACGDLFDHAIGILDLSTIEQIQDPKEQLSNILRNASGLRGRRLKTFNMAESLIQVSGIHGQG